MKTTNAIIINIRLSLLSVMLPIVLMGTTINSLSAQEFSSGSDGSFGPINITTNTTIDLPPDGIIHATTVNVGTNATLRFNRNVINTPVYLLATGDVLIKGTIDITGEPPQANFVGGRGGPGGFDGGPGGFTTGNEVFPGGAGLGPGAGKPGASGRFENLGAGAGAYSTRERCCLNELDGQIYGSPLLNPLVGGSGGGGGDGDPARGGGGGGGAILIASDAEIEIPSSGAIIAQGATSTGGIHPSDVHRDYNGGSGGAIRLVAPLVFGTGSLDVRGAPYSGSFNDRAGDGRVRIDSVFRIDPEDPTKAPNFNFQPHASSSIGSSMLVFPPAAPRLDIIEVAGETIPEGTNTTVIVELPFGTSSNQTVVVQARNFSNNVPIRVVLTPASGNPLSFDSEIDNLAVNPAQTAVNVTIPINQKVNVNAWTR